MKELACNLNARNLNDYCIVALSCQFTAPKVDPRFKRKNSPDVNNQIDFKPQLSTRSKQPIEIYVIDHTGIITGVSHRHL